MLWVTAEVAGDEGAGVVDEDWVSVLEPGTMVLSPLPGEPGSLTEAATRAGAGSDSVALGSLVPVGVSLSVPAAICGPGDAIAAPPGCTRFDYELWDRLSGQEYNSPMTTDVVGRHSTGGNIGALTSKVVAGRVSMWVPARRTHAIREDAR